MGSDESHFNVSVGSDGQSHKTVSTNHNLFDEKGEPKRYRTEVLPLTSLTPYRFNSFERYGFLGPPFKAKYLVFSNVYRAGTRDQN